MEKLLKVALQAALKAGESIMAIYRTDFGVSEKGDLSPLTQADMDANAMIIKYLESTHIPIISEETPQMPYNVRKSWKRCWMVDPLDGTREFVKRNGEFTVNIALIEEGSPILGVIYVPVTRVLYFTSVDGKAAFKVTVPTIIPNIEKIPQNGERIQPSGGDGVLRIVGSKSHLSEATRQYIKEVGKEQPTEIICIGSSLKFCLLAEGTAQLYPRFGTTMEWDTAAGHAICKAVGIAVLDHQLLKPLRYNKPNLENPHFVAGVY